MEPVLPGRKLTAKELDDVIWAVTQSPLSFFVAVDIFGRIITMPPFTPTPMTPDMPTLFRQMADKMEKSNE